MPRLWDGGFGEVEVRRVQPYQATKTYVCPGCHRNIAPATGHYVAVPELPRQSCGVTGTTPAGTTRAGRRERARRIRTPLRSRRRGPR